MAYAMKILGQPITLERNVRFSFRRYRVWWLILLVTIFFDYITTIFFIEQFGIAAEGNQVISWLMITLGVVTGLVIGKLLQLFAVVVFVSIDRRVGNLLLLIVIALNCWAVVINTTGF
jgi:hypothetical protein